MLETEIKKLTAALEANTAALTGGAVAKPTTPTTAAAAASTPVPTPAAPVPAGPAVVAPIVAASQPAAVVPAPVAAVAQPAAPIPASAMTHQQAQAELGAIVQALGDGTQVQATMLQYGSARLNEIPVENLFSLVQACKALITA